MSPLKPKFLLGAAFALMALPHSYGMESASTHKQSPSDFSAAFTHFAEDKDFINQCLETIKAAELHFFWTTGRTLSDNPEYHPDTQVNVGGTDYGHKFFPYVGELLKNSADKLKVKFVCDQMTHASNKEQISALQAQYGDRFEILPIEQVEEKLLQAFPAQNKKVEMIFKNATQGTPVIASDIYRAIGMVYGRDLLPNVTQTQYTYCDVDTFCYGMESLAHTSLIKSLFNPVIPRSSFYFGRSMTNNDLIKLRISDLESYKRFCDVSILQRVSNDHGVLDHFVKIHDIIKRCELNSQSCSNLIHDIPPPLENFVRAVMAATGPDFLPAQTNDLNYPKELKGEWYSPEEILNHRISRYAGVHPPSVLFWGYGGASEEEKRASDAFIADCDRYRRFLSAAFYAKRFGNNHPFNLTIKKYLIDHFPYNSDSFKDLLKVNFEFRHQDIQQNYSLDILENYDYEDLLEGGLDQDTLYLGKNGNKLECTFLSHDRKPIKRILDINIEEDLTRRILRKYRSEILDKASEKGITREPKKGLSYEEWKKEAFKKMAMPIQYSENHYQTLIGLLKQLGIEIPFTEESLDFRNSS